MQVKLRAGKYKIPVELTYIDGRIFLQFKFSRALIPEIKAMSGAKWHGFDDPPRKIWSIADNQRNAFQLDYLQGLNPYARYDTEIISYAYERSLYTHQRDATDFILSRHYCVLAGEMGCVDGDAVVHCNRAGRGFEITIKELFSKFNHAVPLYGERGQSGWDSTIPTRIRSLCGDELRLNRVVKVLHKGMRPTVELILKSGKTLRLTPDHEVCTGSDQYQTAGTLKIGDRVLVNGKWTDKDGYVRVGGYKNSHPRWTTGGVYEHILVMEESLGRFLGVDERVHHINGTRDDNRIENLQLLDVSSHATLHGENGGYHRLREYFLPREDQVVNIQDAGVIDVYDIVCADPYRNFVANGIIVHNCGKTLDAIEVMERSGAEGIWYVAPRSGIRAVEREFKIWNFDITITMMTYQGLTKRMKEWQPGAKAPQVVIFDECQRIKTPTSQMSQAAMMLADGVREDWGDDGYVLLMSGSPAPKSPADWWHQCEVACPGFLREGDHNKFKKSLGIVVQREAFAGGGVYPHLETWLDDENKCAVCGEFEAEHDPVMCEEEYHDFIPSKNEVSRLYKRMDGLVLVQLKKNCLDLPDKIYRRIILEPSQETLQIAKSLIQTSSTVIGGITLVRELSDGFQYEEVPDGKEKCPVCGSSGEMDNPIRPGEKCCCDGCGGKGWRPKFKRSVLNVESPKDDALRSLLDENSDIGRIVIYGGFTGSVDRLVQICQDSGWETLRVDGRGWHCSLVSSDSLSLFQDQLLEHPRVAFIGQPGAAGIGLTLTAASMIVYYSNDFDAEHRIQSEDRIHRPGMDLNRGATIVDLIHLPTDELILDNLQKKRKLQSLTLGELEGVF